MVGYEVFEVNFSQRIVFHKHVRTLRCGKYFLFSMIFEPLLLGTIYDPNFLIFKSKDTGCGLFPRITKNFN